MNSQKASNIPPDPSKLNSLADSICEIIISAGQKSLGFFQTNVTISEKSLGNPVTEADLAVNRLLFSALLELLPEAGWLSEETVDQPARLHQPYTWIVDPLDGTKEFIKGLPEFAISVGLCYLGKPILAVVYNPVTRELFQAQFGRGARLNGQEITVSQQHELLGARVDASRSEYRRGEFDPFVDSFNLRPIGSIAYKLARLASGQCDATWSRGPKNEWDICAGSLLVSEAGGVCVNLDNEPFIFNRLDPKVNGIIATNGALHSDILTLLEPHRGTARTD